MYMKQQIFGAMIGMMIVMSIFGGMIGTVDAGQVVKIFITTRDIYGNLVPDSADILSYQYLEGSTDLTWSTTQTEGVARYSTTFVPTNTGQQRIFVFVNGGIINQNGVPGITFNVEPGTIQGSVVGLNDGRLPVCQIVTHFRRPGDVSGGCVHGN